MEVGDIVKCTHVQFNGDRDDGHFSDKYLPLWGVVVKYDDRFNTTVIRMLSKWPKIVAGGYDPPKMVLHADYDTYEIASIDDLPDEACAELAKFKLTEGVRE